MGKKSDNEKLISILPPTTPEAAEEELVVLAMELARKKLMDGTASSQIVNHFIQQGSPKARLERENLIETNKLLKAKTENLQLQRSRDEMYARVIESFANYGVSAFREDVREGDD